jgi:GAF domain-containing protein
VSHAAGMGGMSLQQVRQLLAVALLLPVPLIVAYALVGGQVSNPLILWASLSVVFANVVQQAWHLWRRPDLDRRRLDRERLTGSLLGAGLLVPTVLIGLEVGDVAVFAGVIATLLIADVHAFASPLRWWLVGWTALAWTAILLVAGVREPATLLLHAAGAIVLVIGTMRIADALASARRSAARARRRAEERAGVLAAVLRTRSLEPDEVFKAVTAGLADVGFDLAVVRRVDAFARTAVALEAYHAPGVHLEEEFNLDLSLLGVAVRERREVVVANATSHPSMLDRGDGLRGAFVIPLLDDGEVVAVVAGALRAGPLGDEQLAAARSLAAAAERALTRLRSYASDRRLVAELERTYRRAELHVAKVADELAGPLQQLRQATRRLEAHVAGSPGGEQAEPRDAGAATAGDAVGATAGDGGPTSRTPTTGTLAEAEAIDAVARHVQALTSRIRAQLDEDVDRIDFRDSARPVRLRALVTSAAVGLGPLVAAGPVVVDIDPDLVVPAEPALLRQTLQDVLVEVVDNRDHEVSARVRAVTREGWIDLRVSGAVEAADAAKSAVGSGDMAATRPTGQLASAHAQPAPLVPPSGGSRHLHVLEERWHADAGGTAQDVHGLRLAFARQIVAAHGGELVAQPAVGGVPAFRLSLPVPEPVP